MMTYDAYLSLFICMIYIYNICLFIMCCVWLPIGISWYDIASHSLLYASCSFMLYLRVVCSLILCLFLVTCWYICLLSCVLWYICLLAYVCVLVGSRCVPVKCSLFSMSLIFRLCMHLYVFPVTWGMWCMNVCVFWVPCWCIRSLVWCVSFYWCSTCFTWTQ